MSHQDPHDENTQETGEEQVTAYNNLPPNGHSPESSHPAARERTGRRLFNGLRDRFQLNSLRLNSPSALLRDPQPAPHMPIDLHEEIVPTHDIGIDVARWNRRRDIPLAILAWAGVVLLGLWLASYISQTILLLVIAGLLAYALSPLVKLLQRVMPRLIAILLVYLVVLTALGGLLYLVVRTSVDQITSLANLVSTLLTPVHQGQLSPLEQWLNSFGISASQIATARSQIITQLESVAGSILPILSGIANAALDVLLVIILSIYLLFDGGRVVAWFRRDTPRPQRGRVRFLLTTIQRIVGGYIRGQLIMCSLIGVLVGVGMTIFGIPYALLLGVLAFVLEFIPILGTLLSGVICVLLALTKGWIWALVVLAYFIVVHIFEGDVVGPRIVGKAVGLHPLIAIVALIAGSELFGIWGALFASPIAGVLQALVVAIWTEWREAHPDDFRAARQKVTRAIAENTADHPLDAEPAERLLS